MDLAGFPKAGARWFQAWWLHAQQPGAQGVVGRAGRPPLPAGHTVHIVESAELLAATTGGNATYHVYTDAPAARLYVDGVLQLGAGVPSTSQGAWMGWFEWSVARPSAAGGGRHNVTAEALDGAGAVVARAVRVSAGAAAAIVLTLDAPSRSTATGTKVLLDGHDVALVRATVVDAAGVVVHGSAAGAFNVSFSVTSGPARVLGVGNGNPFCQEPHQVPWRTTYHGLARAVLKVTLDASHAAATRRLMLAIDLETGKSTVEVADPDASDDAQDIIVTASAPGLATATLRIATSVDAAVDGVLPVAMASTHLPVSLE